jgi:DnaJ family protein C protein 9
LYESVLGVSSTATSAQIKKAYHKKALKLHPDKIDKNASKEEVESAKLKFQAISVAYQILSNDETRKEYDATGELVDEDDFISNSDKDGFTAWEEYFKSIFGSINFSDIDKFANKYQGSDEEKADVLKYYVSTKGDLNKMVACVMCSSKEDKPRWVSDYIEPAIKQKKVPRFETLAKTLGQAGAGKEDDDDSEEDEDYALKDSDSDGGGAHEDADEEMDDEGETTDENTSNGKKKPKKAQKSKPKSKSKAAKPKFKKIKVSKAAQEMIAEDLIAKIRGKQNGGALAQRESAFNSMMDDMEARYSGGGKGDKKKATTRKPKKAPVPDIPEDEFEKIQARLEKNRRRK